MDEVRAAPAAPLDALARVPDSRGTWHRFAVIARDDVVGRDRRLGQRHRADAFAQIGEGGVEAGVEAMLQETATW